ncbi:Type IV pili methyl-accepting chemotaxis transducer N-term, partial [Jannaschia pohangensis]
MIYFSPPSIRQSLAMIGLTCMTALPAAAMTGTPLETEAPVVLDAQFIQDVGGGARIDMSGKLRMLSQRIAASACNEAAGIALDQSVPMIAAAVAEYDRIIAALEHGDDELGIFGAETNRKILADIQALHAVWDPLHVDLDTAIAGDITAEEAFQIEAVSDELLKIAQHMVSLISGRYADPAALMQADALTIDIAGRQRMLAQRMSKNACLIASGHDVEASRAEMLAALEMYDTSLTALRFGMPTAGISPPP